MSCYIYFLLKKKDTPVKDWKLYLAHLTTSDARELSDGLESFRSGITYNFEYDKKEDPMYGYYTPLTDELLNNTLDYYDSEIQEMKNSKARYEKQLQEAEDNYLQAKSNVVLEDIKKTMRDTTDMIVWCDEEIEKFSTLKSYILNAVRDVFDENTIYEYNQETKENVAQNDYELIYHMG